MARREHGFTDTDDYAEEFIRAVAAASDAHKPRRHRTAGPLHPRIDARNYATLVSAPARPPDRVQTRERNGIRTVTVDGACGGDHHKREHAEAAAALGRTGNG